MRDPKKSLERRTLLAGAGTAGALAAAAVALPSAHTAAPPAQAGAAPAADKAEGYRLTEHVKRYYATARI